MSNSNSSNNHVSSAGRLRRVCLLAAALGVLAAAQALAGPQLGTIEECVESGTDLITLPGTPGGTLAAKSCTACATLRLSFDHKTRYFIGKEAVPYTRLLAAARQGPTGLDVFYRPDTRVLTRLRLAAGADAAKQ